MKILYLECNMGASGDMLFGALLELVSNSESFIEKIQNLKIPHTHVKADTVEKCGIRGTHVSVKIHGEHEDGHHHDHHHTGINEISDLINKLDVPAKVKENAISVYNLIAGAEAHVHGKPVTQVHFHEVGMLDAVLDIVAVCLLIEELAPEKIIVSPVHVGYGQVKCAHGILPVPAPATARILSGVPIYSGEIKGELCTPTGAALLTHFADSFGSMPVMTVEKTGYGMGKHDFEAANCLRAYIGTIEEKPNEVVELCCNLDDMTPEAIGYAEQILFEGGALDVYTIPVQMKKNRPGVLLTCICRRSDAKRIAELILLNTTSLGVREKICKRYELERKTELISTKFGQINVKTSIKNHISKAKPEYEDIAKAAKENNLPFNTVWNEVMRLL